MDIKYIKRYITMIIGSILLGLAIGASIIYGWGSDAISIFLKGLSTQFHLSYTILTLSFNFITISISLILDHKQVGLGTIGVMLFSTFGIELSQLIIIGFNNIYYNLPLLFIAYNIYIFAIALIIVSNTGKGPYEALIFSINKYINIEFYIIKWFIDILFLTIGIILGGGFTFTTILFIIFSGKGITFWVNTLNKRFIL